MKTPAVPMDEQTRLKTLESLNILDSLPEERFDRLTRIARRLFRVPIALVSLVDQNRQWFKSCAGLNVTETDRDISFCGHAILDDVPLIVPDASLDPRFADNPLVVAEPFIRFYAGCPLRAPNGQRLGTLCIIDSKPRELCAEDLQILQDLAVMAEREMASLQLATLDELTGISNRRGFRMLADKALQMASRRNMSVSLLLCDLNDFKTINDTYGHAEGDRALIAFAEQLKKVFRDSDIIARLGGDEFVVLLTGACSADAQAAVARLREALHDDCAAAASGYEISFSCGEVEFQPERHLSLDDLLKDGDAQMYKQKQSRPR
ncbi:MAG: sensor domain-containing diguanylate cyclase [Oceanospirillaceae bacterium]|nr:sensor domain-containing diguanylate cyclase [Oceanospirillaceae bacterium]